MAGIDLGSIIRDLGELSNIQRQQTEQISQKQFQQGELGEQIARNLFEVAERSERVEMQQLEAQLEAQNQSRRVAKAAGMDASASNEIISGLMAQMRTDMLAYNAASQQVQQMDEQGNLLANPVGWLNNVLNGPQARATADRTAERLQNTAAQLNNAHALTQSNVQTQNAIAETMTEATIKDQTRANALLAESEALQAEQNAKQFTIEGINTLREFGSVEFNRRLTVNNAVMVQQRHEEQMAMARQQMEQRKKELDMQMEGMESFGEIARIINETQERLGIQAQPVTAGTVRTHWGQNTPMGQRLMALADRGFLAEDTGSNKIGRNPYDAWSFAQQFGVAMPTNLDPNATEAFDAAASGLAAEIEEARRFTTDAQTTELGLSRENLEDPNARADVFNRIYNQSLATTDRQFTEFSVQTDFIKQEYPQIEGTQFYQNIVKPLEDSGSAPSISAIAAQTAESFAAGELSGDEASSGLAALWRAQRDLFNATNGRDAIGAPALVDIEPRLLIGKKYVTDPTGAVVRGDTISQFGISRDLKTNEIREPVDLTDPVAIQHWLNRYSSNKLAREMQEAARGSAVPTPAADAPRIQATPLGQRFQNPPEGTTHPRERLNNPTLRPLGE